MQIFARLLAVGLPLSLDLSLPCSLVLLSVFLLFLIILFSRAVATGRLLRIPALAYIAHSRVNGFRYFCDPAEQLELEAHRFEFRGGRAPGSCLTFHSCHLAILASIHR